MKKWVSKDLFELTLLKIASILELQNRSNIFSVIIRADEVTQYHE